jgi:hypothetical protein
MAPSTACAAARSPPQDRRCGRPCRDWRCCRRSGRSGPSRSRRPACRSLPGSSSPAAGRRSRPCGLTAPGCAPRREQVSAAAAEEEGDVRVLLGLGDAQLGQAGAATISPKVWRRSSGANASSGRGQLRRRTRSGRRSATAPGAARRIRRSRDRRSRRQLARAIGAEIHEHHRIAIVHGRCAVDHRRRHEFVVLAARIAACNAQRAGRAMLAWPRRSRPSQDARGPSACRGPSRSSDRRRWRCARCRACRRPPARRAGWPRPSAAGCRGRRGTHAPRPAARPARAPGRASRRCATRGCARRPAKQAHHVQRAAAGRWRPRRRHSIRRWRRSCRPRSPHRPGSGPGRRCGRRRGSCGRPRNCPSARPAGRRGGLRYAPACAGRSPAGDASSAGRPAPARCPRDPRGGPSHPGSAA